jgi:hypothetical protein
VGGGVKNLFERKLRDEADMEVCKSAREQTQMSNVSVPFPSYGAQGSSLRPRGRILTKGFTVFLSPSKAIPG